MTAPFLACIILETIVTRCMASPHPDSLLKRSLILFFFLFASSFSRPLPQLRGSLTNCIYLHNFSFHVFVVKAGCRCGYFNRTPTWHKHT